MEDEKEYYVKSVHNMTQLTEKSEIVPNVFYVNVLVKDKKFKIYCGDGRQKLRWLSDVAILKYESYNEGICGLAYSIKLENGNVCNLNDTINTVLQNNENVWVLLKEEYILYQEEMNKKIISQNY